MAADEHLAANTEPRTLPEKIWRCECGAEALGVSFYTWRDDPPEWFIEVYKLGGIGAWRWRIRNALNMLLGLAGVAVFMVGGLTDNPFVFSLGSIPVWAAIFMLGSGLWMRWPRV